MNWRGNPKIKGFMQCAADSGRGTTIKNPAERLIGANQRGRVGRGGLAKIAIGALESPTALLSALGPHRLLHPALLPAEKRIQRLAG